MMEQTDFSTGADLDFYEREYAKKAVHISKWMKYVFIMYFVDLVGNLIGKFMPGVASIIGLLCTILYALIYFKLSEYQDEFKTTVICSIVGGVLSFSTNIIAGTQLLVLVIISALTLIVSSILVLYYEMKAYSNILVGVDEKLSQDWELLWKFTIVALIGVIVSIVLSYLLWTVGLIALVIFGIGVIVTSIMRVINQYKSYKAFEKYAQLYQ